MNNKDYLIFGVKLIKLTHTLTKIIIHRGLSLLVKIK